MHSLLNIPRRANSTLFTMLLISAMSTPMRAADDALLTTPTTPEVIGKGLEVDAYQLGVSAYVWGYPLVRMERVIRDYTNVPTPNPATSYRAPVNQIGWARELATPAAKDMPTANNDTFYMSAVVLLDEPFVLSVPATNDRYYVIDVFNMWQELEHYIGRRTTGTKAQSFALVPPGWTGTLPDRVTRLDVTTRKIWLWGRLAVAPDEDTAPLYRMQNEFNLVPLSQFGNRNGLSKPGSLPVFPATQGDPLSFLAELGFALEFNTIKPSDKALFAQFARIGLTEKGFDASKLSPPARNGVLRGLADGPAVAVSALATSASRRNGWDWATGLDSFGFNYPLRALVSGPYLGGNGEREAMYPIRSTDSDGAVLDGANKYEIRFDGAPPVNAFWSLTMYNAGDKMLVDNPINRYKVGSGTKGLKPAADGSITIPIQADQPDGPNAENWLPAPKGNFYVILRLYQPTDLVLSGAYQLPQLHKVRADLR